MNDLISVIIPVYELNKKYFDKCINSILNQNYSNFEVIIVLDGSTQDVADFCESYTKKDQRIIIHKQENKGVSTARNVGIELAKGKWITFIDADDWIENDSFSLFKTKIIDKDEEYDFVMFRNYVNYSEEKNKIVEIKYKEDTVIEEEFKKDIFQTVYGTKYTSLYCCESVWKNFYNREFIINNNIKFIKNLKIGEDLLFNIDVWNKSKRGYFINEFMYHYRKNEDSVMNGKYEIVLEKYRVFLEEYNKKQLELEEKFSINNEVFYLKQIKRFLKQYLFTKDNKKHFFSSVKELKRLCNEELYKESLKRIDAKCLSKKRKMFLNLIRFKMYPILGILVYLE